MSTAMTRRGLLAGAAGVSGAVAAQTLLSPAAHAAAGTTGTSSAAVGRSRLAADATTTALIVGAGYGGAVTALRLAQAGVKTLLLERGLRWPITPAGNTFATSSAPDGRAAWLSSTSPFTTQTLNVYTGVLEAYAANGITALAGAGVGGGSLVNSTVMLEPSQALFNYSFGGLLSWSEMSSVWYPDANSLIGPSSMPDDVFNSSYYAEARAFSNEITAAGQRPARVPLALNWDVVRKEMAGTVVPSVIVNQSIWGANSGAKRSVDRTVLAAAEATGYVTVQTLSRVKDIVPSGPGFLVTYESLDTGGNVLATTSIQTTYLVLAAGSLGTTKLLTRAKAIGALPNLDSSVGTTWGNNGDANALRTEMAFDNPSQGGPSGIGYLRWTDNPYAPTTVLNFPWRTPPADGSGAIGALGQTQVPGIGTFAYNSATDQVDLTWPSSDPRLTTAMNAYTWSLSQLNAADPPSKTNFISMATTSHAVGGVPMGKAADTFGRVHGYQNLFVIDSSLLPGSCASVPPAITVTAIADRAATVLACELVGAGTPSTSAAAALRSS